MADRGDEMETGGLATCVAVSEDIQAAQAES